MNLEIKPLTPALADDYFYFFDNRAFTDHAEWSCCYCTWFHMNKEFDKQIAETVKADGTGDALRRALKGKAEKLVREETLKGYLAYVDGTPVGWCSASDKHTYLRFDFNENLSDFICGNCDDNVKAVTCFVIAPEYRGEGVATALLERVVADAQAEGYTAVEGYPRLHDNREPFDYNGPVRLYEKCGFASMAEQGNVVIMRKEIRRI